jgi:hypothetical protein
MKTKVVRFPVFCPTCRKEWTYGLPQAQNLDSLNTGAAIPAYTARHNRTWNLSASERENLAAGATEPWEACKRGDSAGERRLF